MNGGEAEPRGRLGSPGRRGVRPRSEFRQAGGLAGGRSRKQELQTRSEERRERGVQHTPTPPCAPRCGQPGAASFTPFPGAPPSPPPRPGERIGATLGREGEEAARAARRSRGGP